MVWWNGGRVKILIPGALLTVLDHGDLTPEEFVKNQSLGEQSLAPYISSTVPE